MYVYINIYMVCFVFDPEKDSEYNTMTPENAAEWLWHYFCFSCIWHILIEGLKSTIIMYSRLKISVKLKRFSYSLMFLSF